jgi:hypothetical protein
MTALRLFVAVTAARGDPENADPGIETTRPSLAKSGMLYGKLLYRLLPVDC